MLSGRGVSKSEIVTTGLRGAAGLWSAITRLLCDRGESHERGAMRRTDEDVRFTGLQEQAALVQVGNVWELENGRFVE